ncbi:MAG: hypothetical protein SFV55_14020 [Haliscomenobacter sp.]|uniref:hypothetical protein n=1 Tax=Haliscomenobacter sp. TaxID=2717303 RepID=UPI0029BB74C6|nr:hypothetical protein [Haliscomenobacter sp.]MDX2069540.1 hypothetical protein [Haliscomenobacter sp.]
MLLIPSPTSIAILFTWLLHFIIAFSLKNRNRRNYPYYEGLWKILAYVGLTLAIIEIFHLTLSTISGYIFESMAFKARLYGPWFGWMLGLDIFSPLLFCFNFWSWFRNNKVFRNFQLYVMLAIFLIQLALGSNFVISIIPGWHTTVDFLSFPLTLLIVSVLIWGLNHLILKKESR